MDAYVRSKTDASARDLRATPWGLVRQLERVLNIGAFEYDICAESHTAKAETFFTTDDDSLSFTWAARLEPRSFVFMNPPYSDVTPWLREAGNAGELFVMAILPDDRGTMWYQQLVENVATHAWLPRRRISFLGPDGKPKAGNPKPTVCALYTPWKTGVTTYSRLPE